MSRRTPKTVDSVTSAYWDFDPDASTNLLTLAIILLPSFLAVLVPVIPNAPASTDVALLITDTLMVVVVTWLVKFLIDWPWKWLQEVRAAKQKVLNRVNSLLISGGDVTDHFHTLRRLVRYQQWVLAGSFGGVAVSGVMMVVVRNYIIVEDSRRSIVFSDVNVCIFIVWSSFRLVVMVMEGVRRGSLDMNEYGLVTEGNVGSWRDGGRESGRERELERLRAKVVELEGRAKVVERRAEFMPFPLNLAKLAEVGEPLGQSTVKGELLGKSVKGKPLGKNKVGRDTGSGPLQGALSQGGPAKAIQRQKTGDQARHTAERLEAVFQAPLPTPEPYGNAAPSASDSAPTSAVTRDPNHSGLIQLLQTIRQKYPLHHIAKDPAMLVEIYSECQPLVSKMLKRQIAKLVVQETVNYEVNQVSNYVKDVKMVKQYLGQITSQAGEAVVLTAVLGVLVVTWPWRFGAKVAVKVLRWA